MSQSGQDKTVLPRSRVREGGERGAVRSKQLADAGHREDQAVPVISRHRPESADISNDHSLRREFSGKPLRKKGDYLVWIKIPVFCSHNIIFQTHELCF